MYSALTQNSAPTSSVHVAYVVEAPQQSPVENVQPRSIGSANVDPASTGKDAYGVALLPGTDVVLKSWKYRCVAPMLETTISFPTAGFNHKLTYYKGNFDNFERVKNEKQKLQ